MLGGNRCGTVAMFILIGSFASVDPIATNKGDNNARQVAQARCRWTVGGATSYSPEDLNSAVRGGSEETTSGVIIRNDSATAAATQRAVASSGDGHADGCSIPGAAAPATTGCGSASRSNAARRRQMSARCSLQHDRCTEHSSFTSSGVATVLPSAALMEGGSMPPRLGEQQGTIQRWRPSARSIFSLRPPPRVTTCFFVSADAAALTALISSTVIARSVTAAGDGGGARSSEHTAPARAITPAVDCTPP